MNTVKLNISTIDPERWIGIKGGRFTRPTQPFSIAMGIIFTVLFYLVISQFPKSTLYSYFTTLGSIPYFIVFFTGWCYAFLVLKWFKIISQQKALDVHIIPSDPSFVLTSDTSESVLANMYKATSEPRDYILFNRSLMALTSIRNFGRLGDLEDLLQAQADNDESISESSFTVIRGLVWAIPVLGFIGTVMGLSDSLEKFGQLAGTGDTEQITAGLVEVTAGLKLAFVTTLEALVAAISIQLALTLLQRQEEQLLDDSREYCQRELVSRVRIIDTQWSTTPDEPKT